MRTRTKKQILILGIILVALLIFLLILDANKPKENDVLEIPEGDLSESLFDSQNPDYIKNDAFPVTVECKRMPYTYDTVEEDGAVVDTGTIYPAGDYYIYYAEVPKNVRTSAEVTEQFSKALKIDATSETAGYFNLKQDTGYINGRGAEYEVDYISVQDGRALSGAYIICYRLVIDDEPKECDLIVGCASVNSTSEDLYNCKEIAKTLVYTVKYDEKLDQKMTSEREQAARDAERVARETQVASASVDSSAVISDQSASIAQPATGSVVATPSSDSQAAGSTSGQGGSVPSSSVSAGSQPIEGDGERVSPDDAKTLGVLLKKPYQNLTVRIHWTNSEVKPSMIMSDVQGTKTYDPAEYKEGYCDFDIGEAADGVYMVVIKDYAGAGSFTSELIGD